ncbi:MAG TPA: hypothetical protein VN665_01775, partial [Candidatus Paceibacterota bacterium]|nr:hypothetical protein [Candidatus Paceibacterota bacterium]
MADRVTKSDLLFVIKLCKDEIEKVQPDVHPFMHPKVRADEKRGLEVAYCLLQMAEAVSGTSKREAEGYIHQAIGLMRAWDIEVDQNFDERILASPA